MPRLPLEPPPHAPLSPVPTSFRAERAVLEAIDRIAAKLGTNRNRVVNWALARYVADWDEAQKR